MLPVRASSNINLQFVLIFSVMKAFLSCARADLAFLFCHRSRLMYMSLSTFDVLEFYCYECIFTWLRGLGRRKKKGERVEKPVPHILATTKFPHRPGALALCRYYRNVLRLPDGSPLPFPSLPVPSLVRA